MDLKTRLTEDMKLAMKAGQKDRLIVIRMLLSDVKNIDLNPQKPTAEQVVESYAKKLRKSVEEYEKLGKPTEVAQLKTEIAIVDEYLPKKMSASEIAKELDGFLATHSFTEKQAGQATGMFLKKFGPRADPAVVGALVRERLAGK